jgi:predicted pyridoxine 5'-phosphate oxidase superfamily flavin-nucleotide-binding protein
MPIKKLPIRIVVHSKDIENITGVKSRTARKILQTIRRLFQKDKNAFVTTKEFCLFTGIDEEMVNDFLRY